MSDHGERESILPPGDEHNRRLRDHTHPEHWPVEPSRDRYDLVAIGGGTAGLVASAGAALLGARAALVERAFLGGDCLVTGCVPSKTLLKAAEVAHTARHADEFGVRVGEVIVDFPAVMERVRRIRGEMSVHDGAERMRKRGIDVLFGAARFTSPTTLDIDGRAVRFRRAVICTGARPTIPDIPGLREHTLTSETLFELTELPRRLVVIGGGPIGCEMAQAMARLGSAVTLVQRGPRLLPRDDPGAADILSAVFREEGIDVRFETEVLRVEGNPNLIVHLKSKSGTATIPADRILVATGRTPNVEGLGLEVAGVEFDNRGVKVDRRHRTTNPHMFAAGDICSGLKFTHAAYAQAEYACLNALLPFRLNVRDRVMSWVTFTDPEVAHAGVGWDELRKMTDSLDTYTQPINLNDRAQTESESCGFARIHCHKGSDKIIAATVVCRHAGEVIAGLSLAITNGLRLRHVQKTILAYPTRSELVRKIADEWKFSTLTPFTKRLVGLWFRWSRLWG